MHYHADANRQYNNQLDSAPERPRRLILTTPKVAVCLLVSHDAHGVHGVREDHWYALHDDRQQLQFEAAQAGRTGDYQYEYGKIAMVT
jgi:hypothetical protein